MPAGLVIPYSFAVDTSANFDELNADFQAVVAKFLAGIFDGDCATAMDFNANKISTTAGKRVPETRMENSAVSDRVLQKDTANPGNDALRAVSGDHVKTWTTAQFARIVPALSMATAQIQDGAVTKGKIAANTLTLGQMNIVIEQPSFSTPGTNGASFVQCNPGSSYRPDTYGLLGLVVRQTAFASGSVIAGAASANDPTKWSGGVYVYESTGTVRTGTLQYYFVKLT